MATRLDDLEAVRTMVEVLSPFERQDQQRIIRWSCEKLGISNIPAGEAKTRLENDPHRFDPPLSPPPATADIKSFVKSKNPSSDIQFAATVAYFYAFEAPEADKKEAVTPDDLQDACRKVDRERLKNPGQTLRNAFHNGLLDRAEERGAFRINTVGENLVAVTLPGDGAAPRRQRTRRKAKTKEKAAKRKTQRKKTK